MCPPRRTGARSRALDSRVGVKQRPPLSICPARAVQKSRTCEERQDLRRDLSGLMSIFAQDIVLKDWDGTYQGCLRVLDVNSNIFKNQPNIKIKVVDIAFINDKHKTMAELEIHIDKEIKIDVVDILSFNNDKIIDIKAYKL